MTRTFQITSLAAAILVAGCNSHEADESQDTDLEVATTKSEAEALARALPTGDFADLKLGAKVVGPQGPEVMSALKNEVGNFADMRSYVACPAGIDPCDPNTAPKGTIYTYVFVVTPGEDNRANSGSGKGPDESHVEQATGFSMLRPAHGFTGKAGYSKAEAYAAMGGRKADVVITCEAGALIWTMNAGDGGDQWEDREPITFWWQSTVPPAGPADFYRIITPVATASGKGPYPAIDADATNACDIKERQEIMEQNGA